MNSFNIKLVAICIFCTAISVLSSAQPGSDIKVRRNDQPVIIRSVKLPPSERVVVRPDRRPGTRPGGTPANPGTSAPEDRPAVEVDKERKGPANITFTLTNEIYADQEFESKDIVRVFNTVYRDGNNSSGYYYFLPASYSLGWLSSTGEYEFSVAYNAATEADGRGKTTVTAILEPGLGSNDLRFARELMKLNIKGKPEEKYGVTELISVPMAQSPDVSFTNLGQFDVEAKDISIRAPSDLTDPIYISFSTTRIDDLMGMFFNNIGLYGDVIIYPAGEGMPASIRIPFNLKIDDPGTFGQFDLQPSGWRNGWQNKTDYPVLLSRMNVLRKEASGEYKIYTWQMGDKEVPEKATVQFDASLVPMWLDTHPNVVKMWMDYTIKGCNTCNGNVKDKIIRGTTGSRVNNIEVTILSPLEFTQAELIKIKLRSVQADPNAREKINLPTLTVSKDGTTMPGGQIFIPDGASPDFEYFIQVYMSDGTKYESDTWKKSDDLEVVIGTTQIKEMISHFQDK